MFAFNLWTATLLFGLAVTDCLIEKPTEELEVEKRAARRCSKCVKNLSERKRTGQSSLHETGFSSLAVDGIWNPTYGYQSCTHTKKDHNPYWWVDLGSRHYVFTVAIQNRADCCASRLSQIKVMVGDNLKKMENCAYYSGAAFAGEVLILHCRKSTKGRYVKVQLMKTEYLTLCEVAVFGISY